MTDCLNFKDRFLFETATVGDRGQIVIPKKVRDMFEIHPGETVMLVCEKGKGIGIIKENQMQGFAQMMMAGMGKMSELAEAKKKKNKG